MLPDSVNAKVNILGPNYMETLRADLSEEARPSPSPHPDTDPIPHPNPSPNPDPYPYPYPYPNPNSNPSPSPSPNPSPNPKQALQWVSRSDYDLCRAPRDDRAATANATTTL